MPNLISSEGTMNDVDAFGPLDHFRSSPLAPLLDFWSSDRIGVMGFSYVVCKYTTRELYFEF